MHTKAPWISTETYSYVLSQDKHTTVCSVSGQSLEEKADNCLLIASAPDLLEACKAIAFSAAPRNGESITISYNLWLQAHRSVQKAEGR